LPRRGGAGRFSDISSENCSFVSPRGPQRIVEASRKRPRRPLRMQTEAGVTNFDRVFEGDALIH
jgi:hypothetical protein